MGNIHGRTAEHIGWTNNTGIPYCCTKLLGFLQDDVKLSKVLVYIIRATFQVYLVKSTQYRIALSLRRHKTISDTAFATHKKGDSGAVSVTEGSSTAPIVCPWANGLKSRRNVLSQEKRHRANRPSGKKNAIPVAHYPMPDFYWQL